MLIGTPDHWHKTMTLDAVAAGKDVFVEKPVSHTIEEGAEMVKAIEASKQVVQTGTQQRSWDHWILGKQIIDSGRLGQITFVHTYWYQHARAGNYAPVALEKLDWKQWLGSAPDQPFRPERFYQWRHFWDFGGGCLTDLMTHWIDVVHWYLNVDAPLSAVTSGHNYNIKIWEAPDTVSTTLEFPNFTCAYLGTYVSRVDDGGLEFRGELGTLKIDRARLAFYRDGAEYAPGSLTPEPEIFVRSSGDGSVPHSAELDRLHPEPQDAERQHPRRASGGAHGPHRQRRAARGTSRAMEQRHRPRGILSDCRGLESHDLKALQPAAVSAQANAFLYSASRRLHAFSAAGSL